MSLTFAIDELYEAGWEAGDASACERAADGRAYPTAEDVVEAFGRVGSRLTFQMDDGFGVFLASWSESELVRGGRVVASSRDEAAVFALARMLGSRREMAGMG